MRLLKLLTLITVVLLSQLAIAQTGSIRGVVYEKETGEPVPFCNIFLEGTTYGTSTDIDGFFNLNQIKPGSYSLKASYVGYEDYVQKINIESNKIITQKIHLESSDLKIGEVTISAEREEQKTKPLISIVKITPKQIAKIPTIGSEPDLAQYLQLVPGVVFTGDQGGQLYIRGGPPIQNKVLLDGMVVYNPFHSIGLFSVFDSDLMRNADIYTGGFNADYGGRISSIMDITMRDGNKNRFAGKISGSTFGSKLLIEGPIIKFDPEKATSASFVFSGKTSYLEKSSRLFYNYIDTTGLPFNFTDLYGKVSLSGQNGSKVNVFGFRFDDRVRYQAVSDLKWTANGVGTNIMLVPSGAPVLVKMDFSYSDYGISLKEDSLIVGADERIRSSSISGFSSGLGLVYFLGPNELDFGFEILGFNTDFTFNNSIRQLSQEENTTELAAYMKYKYTFGKLLIEPGFRAQYYASLSQVSPEPRLGMKINVTDRIRIKAAGGLYSQNLISATSDRDVVNLFYGFLSGPQNLQDEFDGKEVIHTLQKAWHSILGAEVDLTERFNLNVEGYYKRNTQLTNINKRKLYPDTPEFQDKPEIFRKDYIVENGGAYGVDFLLKYDYKRVYIWAVYSLGYVTRYDGVIHYAPHFDRRHNINFLGSVVLGKKLNWEASIRWNMGSGFPFTQTQGFYEQPDVTAGVGMDYNQDNGLLGITYAEINEGRLPYYHRMDVNVKYKAVITDNSILEATVSITNVYNRENIFYFDRIKHERVNQLPFMPSVGLNLTF